MFRLLAACGTLILVGTLVMPTPSVAATCEAKSGPATVALLELYTSEGCSSCPPADRWIAELPGHGFGSDRVVPLALHVDYWNYLGWNDRFSQAAFTRRQRDFARHANSSTIYTPEFILSGAEYQHWIFDRLDSDVERINRRPARADIKIRMERGTQTLHVDVAATTKQKSGDVGLYLALFENNLRTEVRNGENNGRTLAHAFVVRRLIGPQVVDGNGRARMNENLKLEATWKSADLGVAAFVQELRGTDVLQALALPLCR